MHPRPVPSKSALRALRHLAYAGSAAAAVGIATANYHIYRRIRVLEKLRETKHVIRCFSNNNGRQDMAQRIEAAEKGQDFSLEAMRAYRPRKRRTVKVGSDLPGHLLAAEGVWTEPPPPAPSVVEVEVPEIFPYAAPEVPRLCRVPPYRRVNTDPDPKSARIFRPYTMRSLQLPYDPSPQKPGLAQAGRRRDDGHMESFSGIGAAASSQSIMERLPSPLEFADQTKPSQSVNFFSGDGDTRAEAEGTESLTTIKSTSETLPSPLEDASEYRLGCFQPVSTTHRSRRRGFSTRKIGWLVRYHQTKGKSIAEPSSKSFGEDTLGPTDRVSKAELAPAMTKPEHVKSGYELAKEGDASEDLAGPKSEATGSSNTLKDGRVEAPPLAANQLSNLSGPRASIKRHRIHLRQKAAKAILKTPIAGATPCKRLTLEGQLRLARHLGRLVKLGNMDSVRKRWKTIAAQRLHHQDFDALDLFYQEFAENGPLQVLVKDTIFRTLMFFHWSKGKYSARAAQMLFPDHMLRGSVQKSSSFQRGRAQRSTQDPVPVYRLAVQHIKYGWNANANPTSLIFSLRRVIHAARLRGVQIREEFFHPVIHGLTTQGEMGLAQIIFDEMVFYHSIVPTLALRTPLITGYARKADWNRVEREIELLHTSGVSRTAPHDFAVMLAAVLRAYSANSSLDHIQAFLTQAIQLWGLVPTVPISTAVISIYIGCQRYDLIRQWLDSVQVKWPQIELETMVFCMDIAHLWTRLGSSCKDVEQGIRAFAYRRPLTSFRTLGGPLVAEVLCRDLSKRIESVLESCSELEVDLDALEGPPYHSHPKTLEALLTHATDLTRTLAPQDGVLKEQLAQLRQHTLAAARLHVFLHDEAPQAFLDDFCFAAPDLQPITTSSGPDSVAETTPLVEAPAVLNWQVLHEESRITKVVRECYEQRIASGQEADHRLLSWISNKLKASGRGADGLQVLVSVYFDSSLYHVFAGLEQPKVDLGHLDISPARANPLVRRPSGGFHMDFYRDWLQMAFLTANIREILRVLQEVVLLSELPAGYGPAGGVFLQPNPPAAAPSPLQISLSFVFLARYVTRRVVKRVWKPLRRSRVVYGMGQTVGEQHLVAELVWLAGTVEMRRRDQVGRQEIASEDEEWWAWPEGVRIRAQVGQDPESGWY